MKNFAASAVGWVLVLSILALAAGCDVTCKGRANRPPLAVITILNNIPVQGAAIRCDGSQSSDPDGDALACGWSVEKLPEKTLLAIAGPYDASITLTPDSGLYDIKLTVSDGSAEDSANHIIYIRPPGAVVGPDVSQIIFYKNGPAYYISFIFSDYVWYDILQNSDNSCRNFDFKLFPNKYFAYYEPGFEPEEITPGTIQMYIGITPANLPRDLAVGAISAEDYAGLGDIDSFVMYRNRQGNFFIPYLSTNNGEESMWGIKRTVFE